MSRALDEARAEMRAHGCDDDPNLRHAMALRVMSSVAGGERDPIRLKLAALDYTNEHTVH
jgi:hypothetical protein